MGELLTDRDGRRLNGRDVVALAWLFLLAVIVLSPILRAGRDVAPGLPDHDARTQWYPWRAFAAESIKGGTLPLWNPYVLCGTPFVGNFQSALFYPPNAIFLVAPVGVAARLSILFHVYLSLLFAYLLARRLGCGRPGSMVTAMTFGFCAAQLLRVPAGHWGVSCAIPWLPLIFLCAESLMRQPSRIALVIGGCAVAMQVLSGVPQYVFITGLATGAFVVLRGLGGGFGLKAGFKRLAAVAAMFGIGATIAAIQLLPGIEAARNGARSLPMRKEWLEFFSLAPENLLTLLVPTFFGGARGVMYWGRFLHWEMNAYLGILGLTLAVTGLFFGKSRGVAKRLGVLAVFMLLLAMGRYTPVMRMVSALVPVSGMFRGSAKFLLPFSLASAILAGMGIEALLRERAEAWKRLRFIALLVAMSVGVVILLVCLGSTLIEPIQRAICLSGECLYPVEAMPQAAKIKLPVILGGLTSLGLLIWFSGCCMLYSRTRSGVMGRVLTALLIVLIALDVVRFGRVFVTHEATFLARGSAWHGAGAVLGLKGAATRTVVLGSPALNDAMLERVYTVEGIEPNPPVRFHQLFMKGQGLPEDVAPSLYQLRGIGPAAELMCAGRILAPTDIEVPNAEVVWSGKHWKLMKVGHALTRALVVHRNLRATSDDEAFTMTLSNDPREVVVLEEDSALPDTGGSAVSVEKSGARLVSDTPNRVVVEAMLREPGWLVLLDNYFPGWTAEVDGKRLRILRADFAFRAVVLSAGSHIVTFRYRPASLLFGFWISLCALVGCGALAVSTLTRKREKTDQEG